MMYAPTFSDHETQQKLGNHRINGISNNNMECNGRGSTTSNDMLSYKERFRNNFGKFMTPPETPPSSRKEESNGNSHLVYLFDKAQGVTPQRCSNSDNTCNTNITSPQPITGDQPSRYVREGVDYINGRIDSPDGSISQRAVPATPDYLVKSNPLYSKQRNNSQNTYLEQRLSNRTPDVESNSQGISSKMADLSVSKPRNSVDEGYRKSSTTSTTSDENVPIRPSFEQTRRHWVYTPKMVHASEEPKVERKLHPGARSRPLPDYLNFRKYSVPLVSPRPRVEVKQKATDDQLPTKQPEMRSLQKSSSEIDSSSVHQLLREGDDLSYYDQNSIRYIGRTNPSKVFQLLQSATGAEADNLVAKPPPRRRNKKPEPEEQPDADDIVDISYVGGNIPSRTFQCLKEAFDDKDSKDPFSSTEFLDSAEEPVRSVKVIHLRPRKSIDNGIAAM